MFLGAMIVVPSAAWVLERFDKTVEEERTGPPDEMPNGEDKAAARLYRIQQYVNVIVKIIDRFTVHPLRPSPGSLRETLHVMCDIPQAFWFHRGGGADREAYAAKRESEQPGDCILIAKQRCPYCAIFKTRKSRHARHS